MRQKMASNKNQHYVPQCYLKSFSTDESKAAICLYNLDIKKLIKNAPIKNQCSKNYFYGEDLVLEKALQPVEGRFSEVVRHLENDNYILTDNEKTFLKEFWLIQYARTEEFSKFIAESAEQDIKALFSIDVKMKIKEVVRRSMQSASKNKYLIDDLKICILKNNTKTDFVTSDHPAVLTNRWYFLNKKVQFRSFGLQSAGGLFILPLTPKILMLAYDKDVYSIANKGGWAQLKNTYDVDAFNYLQLLSCRANIYTADPDSSRYLEDLHSKVKYSKSLQGHKTEFYLSDNFDGKIRDENRIDVSEIKLNQKFFKVSQPVYVAPPIWPRVINWKPNGFIMTNDTYDDFVRQAVVKKIGRNDFYKMLIRKG
jgi:hypothetical protein